MCGRYSVQKKLLVANDLVKNINVDLEQDNLIVLLRKIPMHQIVTNKYLEMTAFGIFLLGQT